MTSAASLMTILLFILAITKGYLLDESPLSRPPSSPTPSSLPTTSNTPIISRQLVRIAMKGQVSFGGLFSTHSSFDRNSKRCLNIDWEQLVNLQGMIYAVELINNSSSLLPNVTIGYDIRNTCDNPDVAMKQTLDLLFKFRRNDLCNSHRTISNNNHSLNQHPFLTSQLAMDDQLVGIIGAKSSRTSSDVQTILKTFTMPQISYAASDTKLTNRHRFPTFFRTVPIDNYLARIIAAILLRLNWNFISIVTLKSEYSQSIHREMMEIIKKKRTCVDENLVIPANPLEINNAISKIKSSKAPVVVLLVEENALADLLLRFQNRHVTGKTFLASCEWNQEMWKLDRYVIGGMMGITLKRRPSLQFQQYLTEVSICNNINPSLLPFWLMFHGIHNFTDDNAQQVCQDYVKYNPDNDVRNHLQRLSYNAAYVIDAVYALAHALHKTLQCNQHICQKTPNDPEFQLAKVIENMYRISFQGMTSKDFEFNANGGPHDVVYNIVNLKWSTKHRVLRPVTVGNWTLGNVELLSINESKAGFGPYNNISQLPQICAATCQPGDYFTYISRPLCCWQCHACPYNTYSNKTNAPACKSCPLGSASSKNQTTCELIKPFELTYSSMQNVIMLIAYSITAASTLFTWAVIIKYRNTPVVKASDFVLSQMLLFGILMCLSVAPLFGAPISIFNCTITLFIFCISIAFVMSIILVKTNRISAIFKTGFIKSQKSKMLLGDRGPAILAILLTTIEVVVCVVASIYDPIKLRRQVISEQLVYLNCRSKTRLGYIVAVGYFALLCLTCVYLAFKTRKLPENFCEAKYINFASITMLLSLATMTPAYFGTVGPFQAAISSFGMIIFGSCVLCCMFGKKLYIILLHPELNTKENVMLDIAAYSFNSGSNNNTLLSQNRVHVGSIDADMVQRRSSAMITRPASLDLSSGHVNVGFSDIDRRKSLPESVILNITNNTARD